jgi:hypothetical protein
MRITVQTHAGYRGDGRPVSFVVEGRSLRVVDRVDRWYDPDHSCFRLLADNGKSCLLKNDMNADRWELVTPRNGDNAGGITPVL